MQGVISAVPPNIIEENDMVSPLNFINPFPRHGMNRAAFQGNMNCPYCSIEVDPQTTPIGFESSGKPKLRFVENAGPFTRVYRCKKCGGKFRYDITSGSSTPYDSFTRGLKKPRVNLPGLKFSGAVRNIG